MISATVQAGDCTKAAKLARQVRGLSVTLRKLQGFPQVIVSCPLLRSLLLCMNHALHRQLRQVPGFLRAPQHQVMLACGQVCWVTFLIRRRSA